MVSQPALRQAERPHHLAARYAPPLDRHRSRRRHARAPSSSPSRPPSRSSSSDGASPRCSSTRCWPPRSRCCPTRSRPRSAASCPASSASACPSPRWPAPSWSSCSPAAPSPCSWPRARSAALHPALRRPAPRPSSRRRPTGRPGRCASSPARSTSTPAQSRTSPGRSSAGSCSSWPTRSWSPTRPTTCSTSSAAPRTTYPHQIFLGTLVQSAARRRRLPRSAAGCPTGRAPQGVRRRRRRRLRAARCSSSPPPTLQRLPGRHGDRRPRLRHVHGRRPRPGRRRAAGHRQRRQGPRRAQHRRRPALRPRARDRPGHPRARRAAATRVLYMVAGICALLGAAAILPVKESASPQGPCPAASGNDEGRERAPCHFQGIAPAGGLRQGPGHAPDFSAVPGRAGER